MALSFPPFPKSNGRLFFVTVTILPQKEQFDRNLGNTIVKLQSFLDNYASATKVIYRFKVTGEPRLIAVIQANNVIGLERSLSGMCLLVPIDVQCIPIMSYETFAKNMNVSEELTKPSTGLLHKEGVYWLEFDVGYTGKTTDEFMAIWKKEAEAVLNLRHTQEGFSIELYKVVAERKVHVFINAPEPQHLDSLISRMPIMLENGSNTQVKCRALMYLEDYCSRIQHENVQ